MNIYSTLSEVSNLQFRAQAASALLGITGSKIKKCADDCSINVKSADETDGKSVGVRLYKPDTLFQIAQSRRSKNLIETPKNGPCVITIGSINGGTGKTTTCTEIALHMQLAGFRVLVIDLDGQAGLTKNMGYEADLSLKELPSCLTEDAIVEQTFSNVVCSFLGRTMNAPFEKLVKMPFGLHGPHLIPADPNIGSMELALIDSKKPRELVISRLLAEAKAGNIPVFDTREYDVIIFDCPPRWSMTSTAALAAADIVVAPVRLDQFSIKGLARFVEELKCLNEKYKEAMHSELVILATHSSTRLASTLRMSQALQMYIKKLAPISISVSEDFQKSLERYIPLSLHNPLGQASIEYKTFAKHLMKQLFEIQEKRAMH